MTNRQWLKSLPEKFYNVYYTYALLYICQGDFDRYEKWLDEESKMASKISVKEKKKRDSSTINGKKDN